MKLIIESGIDGVVRQTLVMGENEFVTEKQMRFLYPKKVDEIVARSMGHFKQVVISETIDTQRESQCKN